MYIEEQPFSKDFPQALLIQFYINFTNRCNNESKAQTKLLSGAIHGKVLNLPRYNVNTYYKVPSHTIGCVPKS